MERVRSSKRQQARTWVCALLPLLVTGVLPAAIVVVAQIRFILNHFYSGTPYLLDAGWNSALVHHAGVGLVNPRIACDYAATFYGLHISPIFAVFSALSYVFPVDRIEWYALFQGAVYAPFGFAVYLVSSRAEAAPLKRLLLTLVWSLAFAFSGQVLVCIGFPHFEPAIAGLLCLLLASVVTNRRGLAWTLLALLISVREDAGLHTGLALLPVLYLNWRGTSTGLTRRTLLALITAAFGASIMAIVAQKTFFPATGLFRAEYLGEPPLAHVAVHAMMERARVFAGACGYVSVPFGVSVAFALLRKDGRYLLGWLAAAPWFLLNFFAHQDEKWRFSAYAGFPFVVGFYWVYLYGSLLASPVRRLRRWVIEGLLAGAGVASIITLDASLLYAVESRMFRPPLQDPAAVRSFLRLVRDRREDLGRLSIDESVSALAIDSVAWADFLGRTPEPETFLFHRDSTNLDTHLLVDLAQSHIATCRLGEGTLLLACTRSARATEALASWKTSPLPAGLAFTTFEHASRDIQFRESGVAIGKTSAPGLVAYNRNLWIYIGTYEVVWDLTLEDDDSSVTDVAELEVLLAGAVAGKATVAGAPLRQQLIVPIVVGSRVPFSWRFSFRGGARVVIERAELRVGDPVR